MVKSCLKTSTCHMRITPVPYRDAQACSLPRRTPKVGQLIKPLELLTGNRQNRLLFRERAEKNGLCLWVAL